MASISFDQSLKEFCKVVLDLGIEEFMSAGIFVRDNNGRLQLVVRAESFNEDSAAKLRAALAPRLGAYAQANPDSVIKDTDSAIVNQTHLALPENVPLDDGRILTIRMIDRRSGGIDWLRPPVDNIEAGSPPRMAFWSLKGGVGRTTALAVLAASVATSGKNVLVVDLDLEAPGIGDFLLSAEQKPTFGILDYLVEDYVGSEVDGIMENITSTSSLVEGQGLIDVCPAVGSRSVESPQNYLAKLYRAYLPTTKAGVSLLFSERVAIFLEKLTSQKRYDAVLIDVRAGLNESTAAALLGLNADVLMFGHMTPQTFSGYEYALANISKFIGFNGGEWRMKLKMVHAKAPVSSEKQREFLDESFDLFSKWLYEQEGDFSFSLDDVNAMHFPWVILDDSNYRDFDPISTPSAMTSAISNATFGAFLTAARDRLRID